MTEIQSRKVNVNKSAEALYAQLTDFKNFSQMMPENVTKFEADEDSFLFQMKGVPEVMLRVEETQEPNLIRLKSAKGKLDFWLTCHIEAKTENTCAAQFEFTGKFNPMVKMMVTKPLTNFIGKFADKVERF